MCRGYADPQRSLEGCQNSPSVNLTPLSPFFVLPLCRHLRFLAGFKQIRVYE